LSADENHAACDDKYRPRYGDYEIGRMALAWAGGYNSKRNEDQ